MADWSTVPEYVYIEVYLFMFCTEIQGLVRSIGVSNFSVKKLQSIQFQARIPLQIVQVGSQAIYAHVSIPWNNYC